VLGVLFFGAVMAAAGDASALIVLNNPFSDHGAATAYIGHDTITSQELVMWKEVSTGACITQVVGNVGTGLNDNAVVTAGPNSDWIQIWNGAYSFSWCGAMVTGLNYAGHTFDINGGRLGDVLISGSGNTYIYGGAGNDIIENDGGAGLLLSGDSGNDLVEVDEPSNHGIYAGGAGDDCLILDVLVTNANASCGDGNDYWSGPGTMPADCERTTNPGSCGETP
jgi:Ca2+-binding RTX toxin-like protein